VGGTLQWQLDPTRPCEIKINCFLTLLFGLFTFELASLHWIVEIPRFEKMRSSQEGELSFSKEEGIFKSLYFIPIQSVFAL